MDVGLTLFGCAIGGLVLVIMALCLLKAASDAEDRVQSMMEDGEDEPYEHR